MKIIEPYYQIESSLKSSEDILIGIEQAARTCYKSEYFTGDMSSTRAFVRKIIQVKKHESVMEHESLTVRFVCDRGISHELVRHRIAAFSQESTRYCNYSAEKFGREITVIRPCFWSVGTIFFACWKHSCKSCEKQYFQLLDCGASPQEARSVLPNSLKTEVVMTCNLREWRHVIRLRASSMAHPQMRQLMIPLMAEFKSLLPEIFDDINPD